MKRKLETFLIDDEFVQNCQKKFNNSNTNLILKNAITNVGSLYTSTDHDEARKVSHVFLNSIKKKNLKATNQGSSGRCWIFSGLNIFRHNVIKALDLENFEFSETYLFFWDKFERANCFLHWFDEYITNQEDINTNDNFFNYIMEEEKWMSDGGYWNFFANLVDKYGLIPKTAMPETFHSEYSKDMNDIIMNILHSSGSQMYKNKNKIKEIKLNAMEQIYDTLVKFLGEPPKSFTWDFVNENGDSTIIHDLSPLKFKEMVMPEIDINDFAILSNIPSDRFEYYKKYKINKTNNVIEKNNCEVINLPIHELKKYAKKSILSGMPVWFAADVEKGFHPTYSSLNDKLIKYDLVFGGQNKLNKKDRILFTNQKTTHAKTIVGLNIDHKYKTTTWQVENSWGFYDNEEPGLDGFLCMDDKWFDEYLGHLVIHKQFLSRKMLNILEQTPVEIEPWESIAPALKVNSR
jgi:bleomycin hydrolase